MPTKHRSIEDTAAEWIGRRDGGLTPAAERELANWLDSDLEHKAVYSRLAAGSLALDRLRELRPANASAIDPDLALVPRKRNVVWLPLGLAAAAAIAIGILTLNRNSPRPFSESTVTAVGVVRKVNLPDGSIMDLNADTYVKVAFAPAERRVQLQRGEAHFSVAKDSARPFVVEADGVAVRAVGTAFNVRHNSGRVEVLVTEGSVRVDDAKGGSLLPPKPGVVALVLAAGERVVVAATPARQAPDTIVRVDPAEVARLLAWQAEKLDFDPTPLAVIVASFNRLNKHQIVIVDESISRLRVGGSFRADDLETFLRLLEANFDVVANRDRDRTFLRARK
jgi:transmembrane sensor